jgi:hypothetical protein
MRIHDAGVRQLARQILDELHVCRLGANGFFHLRDHDHDKPLLALLALVAYADKDFFGKCNGMGRVAGLPELVRRNVVEVIFVNVARPAA